MATKAKIVSRADAKKLCTKQEYEIVVASLDLKKTKPSLYRAKQKVTLARRLRDKFRDLAQRQRREERGKAAPRGAKPAAGNQGSVKKQQLFSETLVRFESYVAKLEKEATKKTAKKSTTTKTSVKKSAPKKVANKKTTSGTGKKRSLTKAGTAKNKTAKSTSKKTAIKKTAQKSAVSKAKKTPSSRAGKPKTGISSLQRKLEEKQLANKKAAVKKTNKSLAQKSRNAKAGAAKQRKAKNGGIAIHAHVKARTKRRQARKDSR